MEILIDFSDDKALMLDNAEWLLPLNYIEFIREIGSQLSVNRMLATEAYKQRLEHGLTFLEFNYMLLQAYDFLELYRRYDCRLQVGGDDQWSNILAGADLVRRKEQGHAYAMTLTLLTTSTGEKMGKTVGGAVWLDPDKLKPYDFYQYWRNIDDADIIKCLKLLTFLPMEEISAYAGLEGQNLNRAKEKLAYEVTGIVHGKEAADKAEQAAKEIFSGSGAAANMPEVSFSTSEKGRPLLDLLTDAKIIPSRSEGRRLIQQKGIYLNDKAIENYNYVLDEGDIIDNAVIIRKGKKRYYRLFFAEG